MLRHKKEEFWEKMELPLSRDVEYNFILSSRKLIRLSLFYSFSSPLLLHFVGIFFYNTKGV
jgi:hypothetical protein